MTFETISHLASRIAVAVGSTTLRGVTGKVIGLDAGFQQLVQLLIQARHEGRWIFLVGNGGSSSIADHTANDLRRCGVKAQSLSVPTAVTSIANDDGYDAVFVRQVQTLAGQHDVLMAISSSGKSTNVIEAVREMRRIGGTAVTLSGMAIDNPLVLTGDVNIHVPADEYCVVEMSHHIICHAISDALGVVD